jgi:hypothetical protein
MMVLSIARECEFVNDCFRHQIVESQARVADAVTGEMSEDSVQIQ